MPNSLIHGIMTRCALELCKPLATGNFDALINNYCCMPDDFYGPRHSEIAPYTFFEEGIQFHYPPTTPVEETYRYWSVAEDGRLFHSRPFVNHNFEHVHAGFLFYFTHIIACLKNHLEDDAHRFLGCLLHMLEDSTFGLHALEGAGGADAFLLDRMADSRDFPVRPSYLAAKCDASKCVAPDYKPCSIGRNADEATMRLYARYVAAISDSRKALFSFILKANNGQTQELQQLNQRMFDNGVKICADVIFTVLSIACGADATPPPCLLTDMEPHVFPFGGFRPYRYTAFERDFAVDMQCRRIPLKLRLPDGVRQFYKGITFGTHAEGELLFWIAPEAFGASRLMVGFHPELHFGKAKLQIVNDGNVVDETTLDDMAYSITIVPRNIFGLRFTSDTEAGCICVCSEA